MNFHFRKPAPVAACRPPITIKRILVHHLSCVHRVGEECFADYDSRAVRRIHRAGGKLVGAFDGPRLIGFAVARPSRSCPTTGGKDTAET